jgi:DNA-binding NarL/FixJ family response regulator
LIQWHDRTDSARKVFTGKDTVTVAPPIRVIIAEDSQVLRDFLRSIIERAPEVELLATCGTRGETEDAIERQTPDVLVTDIRMPPTRRDEGLRIASELRATHPEVGVVVVSQYLEPEFAVALLRTGAGGRGYLLKERIGAPRELIAAIMAVANGGSVIDPKIVDALIETHGLPAGSPLTGLSNRELELLGEVATGKSNSAIADSLVLTKRAVEKHINSIFGKLGLPDDPSISRRVKATLMYLAEHNG